MTTGEAIMDSREENKKESLLSKLQMLQINTNSTHHDDHVHANTEAAASVVVDASKYIKEMKERVTKLEDEIATLQNSKPMNTSSSSHVKEVEVKVETLERGFGIKVYSEEKCPGLLVSILEAFEEMGLQLLEATASCAHHFLLQAQSEGECKDSITDSEVIKQAVWQAISHWRTGNISDNHD